MKSIIAIALILILCQLAQCNTISIEKGFVDHLGSTEEVSSRFSQRSESKLAATFTALPKSTLACTCSGCSTYTDINQKYYFENITCLDSRNFAYTSLNIGSDNTQEMYRVYSFTQSEYDKFATGSSATPLSENFSNCFSNSGTVFNSPNVITTYRCESGIANAANCATKYRFTSSCKIGLDLINATSSFQYGKLRVLVDLIGTDGRYWTYTGSNINVAVKSASYSETIKSANSGSMTFTFPIKTTFETYSISISADNYFGSVSASLVQKAESASGSVATSNNRANGSSERLNGFGSFVLLIALIIFTFF